VRLLVVVLSLAMFSLAAGAVLLATFAVAAGVRALARLICPGIDKGDV
jgi:hypothetical protein